MAFGLWAWLITRRKYDLSFRMLHFIDYNHSMLAHTFLPAGFVILGNTVTDDHGKQPVSRAVSGEF